MKFGFGSSAEKNGIPHIERVAPTAAIPGGEITIHGRGFVSNTQPRPVVRFGEAAQQVRRRAGDYQVELKTGKALGHAYGGGSQFFSMWVVGRDKPA